ncbi:MAG: GTP cyclohydrolase FolE2 [Granulosicoccaceae bacterium]
MALAEQLPDITSVENLTQSFALQWVGMEGIAVPLNCELADQQMVFLNAKAKVHVSLDDPYAKGIHMSRAHALVNELASGVFSKSACDHFLRELVASQQGISQNARFELAFELPLVKAALISEEHGYQSYPVKIGGQLLAGQLSYRLQTSVPYSSTCPCSAALARQLMAQAVEQRFTQPSIDKDELLDWVQQSTVATPHSQRSYAELDLDMGDNDWPELSSFIQLIESTLVTPVQTLVKRRDEQEFARLNGSNLMFCEDAARRLKGFLESLDWAQDYRFKVEHQESLHAHNAVVMDQKFPGAH